MVDKYIPIFFAISLYWAFLSNTASSVVTYIPNEGRFGDHIHSLAQAYWLSYRYNLEFAYMPFEYGELLYISQEYPCYNHSCFSSAYYIEHLIPRTKEYLYVQNDYLYVVHYHSNIKINWEDSGFKKALKKKLMPIQKLEIPEFVSNSLAVHVRTGGSFTLDNFEEKQRNPGKFPTIDYYIHAIAILLNDYSDITHIMICTDDTNPYGIVQQIREGLSKLCKRECTFHISSDYCNESVVCVIYDFFILQQARFLVRPQSNFSLYAELLGNHMSVVKPLKVLAGRPFGRVRSVEYVCEGSVSEIQC